MVEIIRKSPWSQQCAEKTSRSTAHGHPSQERDGRPPDEGGDWLGLGPLLVPTVAGWSTSIERETETEAAGNDGRGAGGMGDQGAPVERERDSWSAWNDGQGREQCRDESN